MPDVLTLQQKIQQLRDEIDQGWADYYAAANSVTDKQTLDILQAEIDRLETLKNQVPVLDPDSGETVVPTDDGDQLQATQTPDPVQVKYPVGFLESVEANAQHTDPTPTHVTEVEFTDGVQAPGVTLPETEPEDEGELVLDPHPGLNATTDEWVAFYKQQGEEVPEDPKRNALRDAWLEKHPDTEA